MLFFNSDLSVSYLAFKTNLLVPILFILATNLSYKFILTTSILLHCLVYFNQQKIYLIYLIYQLAKFDF